MHGLCPGHRSAPGCSRSNPPYSCRDTLATILRPDRSERDALSNLRYTLASLRRTLGDASATTHFLLVDHDTIQFDTADVQLDVADLERLVASALRRPATWAGGQAPSTPSPDATRRELRAAVALYRGNFLDGFWVEGAGPFEEWVVVRREHIAQQVMAALGWLTADAERRGAFRDAQSYARQQAEFEPWNEEAQRALMRAFALDGQRTAALHQFQTYCRILQDELGVPPSDETIALHEAIRAGEFDAVGGTGDTELSSSAQATPPHSAVVARERELEQLQEYLLQSLAGAGHVIFVTGEAGSGKSVLLGEFIRRALHQHAELLMAGGACEAVAGIGDPYLPFREILRALTGDGERRRIPDSLAPAATRRIWAAMPDILEAFLNHGTDLLDIFVPASELLLRLEEDARRFRSNEKWRDEIEQLRLQAAGESQVSGRTVRQSDLFDQLTHLLSAVARRHPLLLVLDDLQWSDPGTIGLLFHLGRRLTGSRVLILAAYRPDALRAPSGAARHPLELVANELQQASGCPAIDLDACDGSEFVEALLRAEWDSLIPTLAEGIFRHTEGQPLFTVELLRTLVERGDLVRTSDGSWQESQALHWESLPARVDAAIAERMGQLPEQCRLLLAAASVEGQEFTAEIVARALAVDERDVLQLLSRDLAERYRLVVAEIPYRRGHRRFARYRFRHYLFRKYLYDHLDAVQRVYLHEAVGGALEALQDEVTDALDAIAPRLAWHFEEAMIPERAAVWHLRAGKRATCLTANTEAIAHLTRGIALLETVPETPDRLWLQLELYLALLPPLTSANGFRAPEHIRALEAAYVISRHPALAADARLDRVAATMARYTL